MSDVEPLQQCEHCRAYCAPGMACVSSRPGHVNAEQPCREKADGVAGARAVLEAVIAAYEDGDGERSIVTAARAAAATFGVCDHEWEQVWDGSLGYTATDQCHRCREYRPTPCAECEGRGWVFIGHRTPQGGIGPTVRDCPTCRGATDA